MRWESTTDNASCEMEVSSINTNESQSKSDVIVKDEDYLNLKDTTVKNAPSSNQKAVNITPKDTIICNQDTSTVNEGCSIDSRIKELKQLELKLKKKEEQLKIKEAMINDDAKEKSKILDRLYKAETRNYELEHRVKTLNRRIELLEATTSRPSQRSTPHEHNMQKHANSNSTDELISGVRDKVTKYILNKIDIEIDELCKRDNEKINRSKEMHVQEDTCRDSMRQHSSQSANAFISSHDHAYDQYRVEPANHDRTKTIARYHIKLCPRLKSQRH